MVSRLFQILKLVRSIVVSENEPELLAIKRTQDYAAFRLHNILEDVHVYLPRNILIQSCVRTALS